MDKSALTACLCLPNFCIGSDNSFIEVSKEILSRHRQVSSRHLRCLLSIHNRYNIVPASGHKQLQPNRDIILLETTALNQRDLSQGLRL